MANRTTYWRQLATVTKWEYTRFFKIKNELIGIGIMLVMATLSFFGTRAVMKDDPEKPALYLTDAALKDKIPGLAESFDLRIALPADTAQVLAGIREEKKGGLLARDAAGHYRLWVYKSPDWLDDLKGHLDEAQKQQKLLENGISDQIYTAIQTPADLKTSLLAPPKQNLRSVPAFFFAGFMMLGVFVSFAYQFTAITGEKQLKITEQIISAIKPQVWMDGKILGITLTGLSSITVYMILSALGAGVFFQYMRGDFSLVSQYIHLPSILLFLLFTFLGVMMWNALLAAVASMITDPNNSAKTSLMMLPIVPSVLSFFIPKDPDNAYSLFMSWFPLTSATGMPVRFALTQVPWWEVAGSFLLLFGTFYLMRRLAAGIFRFSILMSGKEPTFREAFRWMRRSN